MIRAHTSLPCKQNPGPVFVLILSVEKKIFGSDIKWKWQNIETIYYAQNKFNLT